MCDPATIIGIVSAVSGAAAAANTPEVPDPIAVAPEALEDLGADVLIGGSETVDDEEEKKSKAAEAVTSKAGLNTIGTGTGISIL